ncbi:hypothetical protein [Aliicoccus persicus]|uniref:ABC-2 type transport system permease protein n=1 Tax=Aliicoccus persicus TaxID=930138 RepID=A0A662Z6U1_9STAP|nr:hypothetical protein [Aliicoccus persicus]SEW01679.1 hypothetical protein SAMN05192557_1247 [Aliicoccus persicus]
MKSKTSFWNKSLVRYFFNNIVWLALIYFIGLLLIHIPALISHSSYIDSFTLQEYTIEDTITYFRQLGSLQHLFTLVMVTIIAITQFDYKNHEASSDFIHALPIKRTQILTQGIIIGTSILFILTAVVGLIIYLLTFGLAFELPFAEIMTWILFSWYVIFVTYSFTIFVGMFVKRAVLQALFTAAMMLLPYITWVLSQFAASTLFVGASSFTPLQSYGFSRFMESLTFPVHILSALYTGYTFSIIFWVIFAIILVAATYMLYNRHHVERTAQAFYFDWLHVLLSAWLTTLGMLVFGSFMSIVFSNWIVTIVSYFIGLGLAYLIVEMILQFTPRIKFSLKSMIAALVFALTFWIIFFISWHVHFSTIPNQDDIEAAYIYDSRYHLYDYFVLQEAEIIDENHGYSTKKSDIEYFHSVHKEIIENRSNIFSYLSNGWQYYDASNEVNVSYRLSNGDFLHRTYLLDDDEMALYDEIVDRVEVKNILDGIINIDAVNHVTITTYSDTIQIEGTRSAEFVEEFQNADNRDELSLAQIQTQLNPMLFVDVGFELNGIDYYYWIGNQSISYIDIYNSAIQSILLDRQEAANIPISESLGLSYSGDVYIANLSGEIDEFVEAIQNDTVEEVFEAYDFERVKEESLEDVFEKVNDAAFDGNGELVLVYAPVYSEEFEIVEEFEDLYDIPFNNTTLNILGLED